MHRTKLCHKHPHEHAFPWLPVARATLPVLGAMLASSLRAKTLLIVMLTTAGLLLVVSIALHHFLGGSFVLLEAQVMQTNAERLQHTLLEDLHDLEVFTMSYALWDDTYAFVQDRNPDYVELNLHDKAMYDANLNLYVVFDTSGRLLYGKAFDLERQRALPLPERFRQLAPDDPLVAPHGISGVVLLSGRAALVSAHPILTSTGKGTPRGTLVMGRFLSSSMIEHFARRLQLSVDFFPAGGSLPTDVAQALPLLSGPTPQVVLPRSDALVAGYQLIDLIDNIDQPGALVVRIEMPRTIVAQGQTSVLSALVTLLLAGVVFGGVMLLLLERFVLARLARLSRQLSAIGASGDLSERVNADGQDEIGQLGGQIDGMLQALQHHQSEQQHLYEENIRAKREFLAVVSHELRTPLTPLCGFIDMFQRDANRLEPEHRMYLEKIHASAAHLSALVEDVLEIARIEANRLELDRRPIDAYALVSEAAQVWRTEVERAAIRLTVCAPDELLLDVDIRRIRQILVNLISNAIKYTGFGGTITVSAVALDQEWAEIQVQDTGIGMTSEQLARLFTPLYQDNIPLYEHVRGTGLGLTIARVLVERHGGKLLVSSQPNIGSTFSCVLPRYCPTQ